MIDQKHHCVIGIDHGLDNFAHGILLAQKRQLGSSEHCTIRAVEEVAGWVCRIGNNSVDRSLSTSANRRSGVGSELQLESVRRTARNSHKTPTAKGKFHAI